MAQKLTSETCSKRETSRLVMNDGALLKPWLRPVIYYSKNPKAQNSPQRTSQTTTRAVKTFDRVSVHDAVVELWRIGR
jgi:hypothetical protein